MGVLKASNIVGQLAESIKSRRVVLLPGMVGAYMVHAQPHGTTRQPLDELWFLSVNTLKGPYCGYQSHGDGINVNRLVVPVHMTLCLPGEGPSQGTTVGPSRGRRRGPAGDDGGAQQGTTVGPSRGRRRGPAGDSLGARRVDTVRAYTGSAA